MFAASALRQTHCGLFDWPQQRIAAAMTQRLSIIVVEKDRERAMLIVDGLRDAGNFDVMVIAEETGLARRIAQRKPDLVLIDAGNPSRDVLEELTLATAPL